MHELRISLVARCLQQVSDARDLGEPGRRGTDIGRCGRDVNELHCTSLARTSDISEEFGEHLCLGLQRRGPLGTAPVGEVRRRGHSLVDLAPQQGMDLPVGQIQALYLGGARLR
jgi:hypothetical protein